jgi:hypothetical protein
MAVFCRRLLATFVVMLLVSALRAQDSQIYRPEVPGLAGPVSNTRLIQPVFIGAPRIAPAPHPPRGPEPVTTTKIVQAAGIIFSGHVISIGSTVAAYGRHEASTVVTFQVEHALRGAVAGQILTIREWAGLWNRGERYRVGERVFLFLYPVSKLGFTSPVGGAMGRFGVDGRERIVMNPQNFLFFAKEPSIRGKTLVPYADFLGAIERMAAEN